MVGSSGSGFGFTTRTLAFDRHVSLPARIQPVHGVMPNLRPVMRNPTQVTDRSALVGREGQEFSPPRIHQRYRSFRDRRSFFRARAAFCDISTPTVAARAPTSRLANLSVPHCGTRNPAIRVNE